MEQFIIYLPAALAVLGLLFMFVKAGWVGKQDAGDGKMQSISKSIQEGAMAFLKAEYRILLIFVVIASIALFIVSTLVETSHWIIVVAFVCGAFFFRHWQEISVCVLRPVPMYAPPKQLELVYHKP
jgi:K(+)-stimulated pyrophosphate-energized sodium pump